MGPVYDVAIRVSLRVELEPADLQLLAVRLQKSLDAGASRSIRSIAVTGTYEPPQLEIGLDVAAASPTELQEQIATVISRIEHDGRIEIVEGNWQVADALTV